MQELFLKLRVAFHLVAASVLALSLVIMTPRASIHTPTISSKSPIVVSHGPIMSLPLINVVLVEYLVQEVWYWPVVLVEIATETPTVYLQQVNRIVLFVPAALKR